MTLDADSNPYTPTAVSMQPTHKAPDVLPHSLTDADLADLRVGTLRAKQRAAAFEPYLWPVILLVFSLYQFAMGWTVLERSGTSFSDLLYHDRAGFPAASYEGGFVQTFDRFMSGFLVLFTAVLLFVIMRAARKRELQNHRLHTVMLEAGLVPRVADSAAARKTG